MNFYKRSIRYLFRKRSKTAILFFVLLIAETMILCTVTILRASEEAKMGLQEKTKAKVVAEITDENHPITADDIEELKKLENIKDINRMAKTQGYPDGFRLYTGSDDTSKENNQVQFVAYDDLESDGPFSDGQLRMMEGEYPSAQNQVVINQKLADMNQWKLGAELSLHNEMGTEVKAVIAGFYSSGMESKQTGNTLAVYRIENTIYGAPELALQLQAQKGYESVSIYAKNPEQLSVVEQKVSQIFGERVELAKSDALYQQIEQPLEQVVRVVKLMQFLTMGTAAIVITLLLCMWMRARKKETAIYISLGEHKVNIFLQMLLESFMVFLLATAASVLTGSYIAKALKKMLFSENQIPSLALKIGIQGTDIGWLVSAGLGILLLAVGISLVPVLLTNPKDTLSEMEG
ncbi:UNVERIFIED_CONTAM: putative ABC transport system permease protein [Murimonas intestini]|uniref:ABC transport system permease protein n=2 Tax=Murimonas intestini TaxID=1337051 RepID=A0AB73TAH4_9FIRM